MVKENSPRVKFLLTALSDAFHNVKDFTCKINL